MTNFLDIQERLVALTRDMILIPSIPSREDDRQRCFEFIKNHLESLETIEVREFSCDGIPSLVAGPVGVANPEILMLGHLDVITHPDISVYRSHIKDGCIYGPGAGDMKGGLAIMLEVFRKIHSQNPKVSLGVAITADEEIGGASGVGYLIENQGLRCKQAMIPDGGSINAITVEEKGILHLKVSCQGHEAHAARPWLGSNPIEHLMDQLNNLRSYFDQFKQEKDVSCEVQHESNWTKKDVFCEAHHESNWTKKDVSCEAQHESNWAKQEHWYSTCAITIVGTENQTTNRIAQDAYAVLDIRFVAPFTVEKILDEIKKKLGPRINLEIIISAQPTHLFPDPLYQEKICEIMGEKPILLRDDGGSDARYLVAHGIPVMMSRPLVGNLHAVDEWIDIRSMVDLYHIYEKYLTEKLL